MLNISLGLDSNSRSRTVVLIVRQSTGAQAKHNQGSTKLQFSLREFLSQHWPADRIIEYHAKKGESGSRGKRELIEALLQMINSGTVGAIAYMRGDRLGRTALESEQIMRAAAEHGTLILTEGRVYNPAAASDKLMLSMMSSFAEYENNARTSWMVRSRLFLAKEGAFRVVLPTGLIAGSPDDPEFVRSLGQAGLMGCLDDLSSHTIASSRAGRKHYVLPYPDKDVNSACEKRMEYMLTHRSLEKVIEQINNDPEYPRPGKIPITKAVRRYHPEIDVKWIDVNHPYGRAALKKWFRSPAIYGIYQFKSEAAAKLDPSSDPEAFTIRIESAFPGFATPDEERRVARILDADTKPWRVGSYKGPRQHALDVLKCGHTEADGTRCGVKLQAWYQEDGWYGYYSHACRFGSHKTQHIDGALVDGVVENQLLSVFDMELLRTSVARLQLDQSAARARITSLQAELDKTQQSITATNALVLQAKIDNNHDREIHYVGELDRLLAEKRRAEGALGTAKANVADFLNIASSDRDKIVALAGEIRRLLPLTREKSPDLLRALLSEMIDSVYFNRISGFACEVELVFPEGASIKHTFMTRPINASRIALEFAAGKLAEDIPPAAIAEEMNLSNPKNHKVPWDEDRVLTAPYALQYQEQPELRKGIHRPLDEIAREAGVDVAQMLDSALAGELGPGFYQDGTIHLAPEQAELHRRFPEIARKDVASEMGWDVEDVISRAEASELTGRVRGTIVGRARRRGRLGVDAAGQHWVLRSDFPGPGPLPRKKRAPNKRRKTSSVGNPT